MKRYVAMLSMLVCAQFFSACHGPVNMLDANAAASDSVRFDAGLDQRLHGSLQLSAINEVATIEGEQYVTSRITAANQSADPIDLETSLPQWLVRIHATPDRAGQPLYSESHQTQINNRGYRPFQCGAHQSCEFVHQTPLAALGSLTPGTTYYVSVALDVENPARATTPFAAGTLQLP